MKSAFFCVLNISLSFYLSKSCHIKAICHWLVTFQIQPELAWSISLIISLRTADVFPVVASLPEATTGNTSAVRRLPHY